IPRLDKANAAALVNALESPSGLVRDLAQQQLIWRKVKSAAPALEALVTGSRQPETRVQALTTLDLIGELQASILATALADEHPGVRRQAVRLTESFADSTPDLLSDLVKLVNDPDPNVRQQVAYSLGEWTEPEA